jgi:hypothetical protein
MSTVGMMTARAILSPLQWNISSLSVLMFLEVLLDVSADEDCSLDNPWMYDQWLSLSYDAGL